MILRLLFFVVLDSSTILGLPLSDHFKSLLDKTSSIYEATGIRVLDLFGIDHNLETFNVFGGDSSNSPPGPPITRENPYLRFDTCPNTTEILQFQKYIINNPYVQREYYDNIYRYPVQNYEWPEFYHLDFSITAVWCDTTDNNVYTNPTKNQLAGASGVVLAKNIMDRDDNVGSFLFENGGRRWGFLYRADIPLWIRYDVENPVDFGKVKLDWMDAVKVHGNSGKGGFNQVAVLNGDGKDGPVYRFFKVGEPYYGYAAAETVLTVSAADGRVLKN